MHMGVREDTLRMLRDGLSPKEITKARGVNINTTLGYLDQLIGRGDLRRSDIFFSVPKHIRDAIPISLSIGRTIQEFSNLIRKLNINADSEDVIVVMKYGDSRYALGDMYEDIRTIETHLHQIIQEALEEKYGDEFIDWWRQGIPEPIRKNCVVRQEEDPEPVPDPYCYTDLLDLWQILDRQWKTLKDALPDSFKANKKELQTSLFRLNLIRRQVMHPVRGVIPSEEDFEFIREFKGQLLIRSE
jgi:hypothetical protein